MGGTRGAARLQWVQRSVLRLPMGGTRGAARLAAGLEGASSIANHPPATAPAGGA